eukprot:1576440-Rhodomonas_salina.1
MQIPVLRCGFGAVSLCACAYGMRLLALRWAYCTTRLHDLSENVEVFGYALQDLKQCSKLTKVLERILAIGNYLNGT